MEHIRIIQKHSNSFCNKPKIGNKVKRTDAPTTVRRTNIVKTSTKRASTTTTTVTSTVEAVAYMDTM